MDLRLTPAWRLLLLPILGGAVAIALRMAHDAPSLGALLADKDFVNYWLAGRLALSGQGMDLFGPQPVYFRHIVEAFGEGAQWRAWSYPPHYLLMIWPLGFLPYPVAAAAFLAVTGMLFAWAARAYFGAGTRFGLAALLPFAAVNLWAVQNGFLTGAFFLGALALRERRPVLAGLLLACLTVKPQLGLLFPLLMLAERRWRVLLAAAGFTLAAVALSAALFGLDAWRGYFAETAPYMGRVMAEGSGVFVYMLTSSFGYLRTLGVPAGPALWLHAALAAPAAALAVRLFLRGDAALRGVALAIAAYLVTPYALTYDFGPAAAAAAVLAQRLGDRAGAAGVVPPLVAVLPLALPPAGLLGVPFAPPVLMAALILAVTLTRVSSPAAASG